MNELMLGQAHLYTCWKCGSGHAAHPYFEDPRTRCERGWRSVAGETVSVRQRTALYRSSYSSKGIPPLAIEMNEIIMKSKERKLLFLLSSSDIESNFEPNS